ncbi:MAG: hypothetical protein WCV92_05390 [Candidatus Buchananbacteria bacterium]
MQDYSGGKKLGGLLLPAQDREATGTAGVPKGTYAAWMVESRPTIP